MTVVDREENMLQKLKNNNKKVSYFIKLFDLSNRKELIS
jgi:hypothetical protein